MEAGTLLHCHRVHTVPSLCGALKSSALLQIICSDKTVICCILPLILCNFEACRKYCHLFLKWTLTTQKLPSGKCLCSIRIKTYSCWPRLGPCSPTETYSGPTAYYNQITLMQLLDCCSTCMLFLFDSHTISCMHLSYNQFVILIWKSPIIWYKTCNEVPYTSRLSFVPQHCCGCCEIKDLAKMLSCLQPVCLSDASCLLPFWIDCSNVTVLPDPSNYFPKYSVIKTDRTWISRLLNDVWKWNY